MTDADLPLSKIVVLVVEDDPTLRSTVASLFREPRFIVKTAAGGHEAVEIIKTFHIDLVLTDETMPRGTGSELVHAIEKLVHTAALDPIPKVILMTGYSSDAVNELVAKQMVTLIQKPFSKKAIFSLIDGLFGGQGAE